VLCVGDSLTGGGGWPTECARRLTGTAGTPAGLEYGNITFIGSVGTPPVEWCGYGGWTWSAFIGTGRVSYWVTSVGHDKTMAADQHSVWLDSSTTNTWQLEAVDGDLIKFNPLDGQTDMPPATDTLTWVSGGTNHADIIYSVETEEPGTPFWDPIENEFSFAAFMNAYGFSGDIDVCYVLLGWNEVGVPTKSEVGDHASSIANARTFIDKLHSDYPSCEVRVMGIQMPSMNGGLAANYGAGDSLANYYKTVRCANSLNIEYQNLCNEAAYSGFCRYIGIAAQFDSEWNMSYTTHVVNDRSAVTENRGTNGVHPASGGYYQIGDAVFRDFIRSFCSD